MKTLVPKIIKIGLYSIFVLPLIFTPFTFFPWHFGKTLIFEIIIEALVVLFLARLLFCHSKHLSCHPERPHIGEGVQGSLSFLKRLNLLDFSLLLFLLIILITSFFGVNFANSFWGNQSRANGVFVWLHFGVFYFLLKSFFQDKEDWSKIFIVNTAVAFLVGLSFIFQKYLPADWQSTAGGGLVGNRAFFASYILISLGFSFYLLTFLKSKIRWLFGLAILFFVYFLFISGIRGAFLGLSVGVFAGSIIFIFNSKNKKIKKGVGAGILFFLLLASSLLFFRNHDFIKNNFPKVYNLTNFSYTEGTGSTRLMAWEIAIKGIKERPILGWGWGDYDIPFNKYYNPQFLKAGFSETVWDKPHNWLLEIGVTSGIFGFLGYLSILILAGVGILKNKKEDVWAKAIFAGLLLAYLVQDLFLFETSVGLIPWFALLAFISLFFVGSRQKDTETILTQASDRGKESSYFSFSPVSSSIKKIFLFFFAILFVFLIFFNFSLFKTSYLMRQAELSDNFIDWKNYANQILDDQDSVFAFENVYFLAVNYSSFDQKEAFNNIKKDIEQIGLRIVNELDATSAKNKNNYNAYLWAGKIYTILGERINVRYFIEAEKKLLLAQKLAPDKQELLFVLGRLYLLGSNFSKAIEIHQLAVAKAPDLGISHWFLGLAYIGVGDVLKGTTEVEKAQDLGYTLDMGQEQYVADIYFQTKQFAKLIESYKRISKADPENVDWQIKLAVAYALNGDKKNALEIAQSLLAQFPELKSQVDQFINQYKLR